MLVAVYGTLKKGYGNNRILQQGNASLIQEDIVDGYELYYSGFPVANPNKDTSIRVEVWDIHDNKDTLARLDQLEGTPFMYTREEVETRSGHKVNMYVGNPASWRNFTGMTHCHIDGNEHYWSR